MQYKVTRDCLFKYIFGNPKNTSILISLVNAVLKDSDQPEITSATIQNPFNIKEFENGKESVIDIRAKDGTGKIYNIEMQAQADPLFGYRSLYYWAKLYSNQMKAGEEYNQLNPVICINILDFNLFKDANKAHICFVIREKDSNLDYNDHLAIHYIELPKVTKNGKYGKLYMWLRYMKYEGMEDKELTDFIQNDPDIKTAHEEYEKFLSDEHLQHLYLAREMYQHDEATRIATAKEEGIKEGIGKGIEKGIGIGVEMGAAKTEKQIVLHMDENGFSIQQISEITGLNLKCIKDYLSEEKQESGN